MKDPVFPVFAGLGTVMPMIPLIWHWRNRNWAMIFLMLWIALANGIMFINTIVWYNTTDIIAPVWCDISTRLYLMTSIAVPASVLCIARRLEVIASTRQVSYSKSDTRRRDLQDFALCLGLPIVFGILSTIYWGHRFDIYEGMGCFGATYISWPWVVFNLIPVLLTSTVSLVYSLLALRWFVIRRRQFKAVLASSGANLDQSRYLRMMVFCSVDILVTLPMSIWNTVTLFERLGGRLLPYTSFSDVHEGYSAILQIPASYFDHGQPLYGTFARVELGRWVPPISAIIFVSIFGFSKEAIQTYRRALHRVRDDKFGKTSDARQRRMPKPLMVTIESTVGQHADEEKGMELVPTPSNDAAGSSRNFRLDSQIVRINKLDAEEESLPETPAFSQKPFGTE